LITKFLGYLVAFKVITDFENLTRGKAVQQERLRVLKPLIDGQIGKLSLLKKDVVIRKNYGDRNEISE
jgi:hypothetical protein